MLKFRQVKVMQNIIADEQISAKEADEIRAEVHKIFEEVRRSKEKMDNDQRAIERMRTRTRAVLEQLEKAA
jgi:thiamine biosynthesis lipoprotein ApbE